MQKMTSYIIVILCIFISQTHELLAQKDFTDIKTIVIDAGHGGKDPGASGTLTKEKFITLNIALKLGYYLNINYPNINVIFTRKGDKFIPLRERCEIANRNKADLFISIHANASYNSKIHGTETYTLGLHKTKENLDVAMKENSVILFEDNYSKKYNGFDPNKATSYIIFNLMQGVTLDKSVTLAQHVEDEFKNSNNRHSRGVRQAGFWVLKGATMPSILIETGFISNKDEEKYLCSESGQDNIALAIFNAIKKYKEHNETPVSSNNNVSTIVEKEYTPSKKLTNYIKPPVKAKKTIKKEIIKPIAQVKEKVIVKKAEIKKEIKKITPKKEIAKKETPKKVTQIVKVKTEKPKEIVKKIIKPSKTIKKAVKTSTKAKVDKKENQKIEHELSLDDVIQNANNGDIKAVPYYGVQVKTSLHKLDKHKGIYTKLKDVNMYRSGKTYKYYLGKTHDIKTAIRLQNKTKLLIKDCFVIAFYKNKRISIKEAKVISSQK